MTSVPPPAPRWVKVFGILIGVLLVIVIILHLIGRGMGNHGIR
jgi:hypothetical protein